MIILYCRKSKILNLNSKFRGKKNLSIPNGGKSKIGPDMDNTNVELNEPILYSHTPNPVKNVNYIARPNPSDNTYSRPVIDNASYYISSNRVNTLKNNPYVNDIYHQKNYDY